MSDILQSLNQSDDQHDIYERKYYALKRKCEEVQQTNEKLVNRIRHVKKILRKYKKLRRFLMARLDSYGDRYMDVWQLAMFEEAQPLSSSSQTTSNLDCNTLTRQLMDVHTPPNVNPFSSSTQSLV